MSTPADDPPDFADAFENASEAFDRLHTLMWEPISRAGVLISRPQPGERVLDACCGTGASALPAARPVGSTGHVHGVDLAGKQIAAAARRAPAEGLSWAQFTVATILPPATPGYDLVQCVLGIFLFPDLVTGTEHRIDHAHPSGRVAFTIWNHGAIEPVGRHLLAPVLPLKPQLADWAQTQKDAGINQINTAVAFTGWLGERGLKQVRVRTHPHGGADDHLGPGTWDLMVGSGFRALLDGLDSAQVAQVRHSYLQELATHEVDRIDATTLIGTGRTTP